MIILPGWQHNHTHWKEVCTGLSDAGCTVSFIDFPGFGIEPGVDTIQTLEDASDWIESKITEMNISEPILIVGHSFGGRVAVTLAARQMSSISKMILIGSPNLYHTDLKTKLTGFVAKITSPLKMIIPERLKSKLRSADYSEVRGSSLQNLFTSIIGMNQTTELLKISIPVKLMWGEKDAQVPVIVAKEMAKILIDSSLEVIQNTGHDIHLEKPQLLIAKVAAYAKNS